MMIRCLKRTDLSSIVQGKSKIHFPRSPQKIEQFLNDHRNAKLTSEPTLLFAANVDADSIRCGEYVIEDE